MFPGVMLQTNPIYPHPQPLNSILSFTNLFHLFILVIRALFSIILFVENTKWKIEVVKHEKLFPGFTQKV